jgi:hypothetical protein
MDNRFKLIFLVYVARSGSTFLAQLLARHTDRIVVLPEIKAVEYLISIGNERIAAMSSLEILNKLKSDPRWTNLNISDDETLKIVESKDAKTIVYDICSHYSNRQSKKPSYVIIKNSTAIWQYDLLKVNFDDFIFLHIKRDIRGSSSSRYNAKSSFHSDIDSKKKSIVQIAKYWTDYIKRVNFLMNKHDKIFELSYEDLIMNKSKIMKSLLQFLGIDYVQDSGVDLALSNKELSKMHSNVFSDPLTQRIYGWKKDLNDSEGYVVEFIGRNKIEDPYYTNKLSILFKGYYICIHYIKYYYILLLKLFPKLFSFNKQNIFKISYHRLKFKIFGK